MRAADHLLKGATTSPNHAHPPTHTQRVELRAAPPHSAAIHQLTTCYCIYIYVRVHMRACLIGVAGDLAAAVAEVHAIEDSRAASVTQGCDDARAPPSVASRACGYAYTEHQALCLSSLITLCRRLASLCIRCPSPNRPRLSATPCRLSLASFRPSNREFVRGTLRGVLSYLLTVRVGAVGAAQVA